MTAVGLQHGLDLGLAHCGHAFLAREPSGTVLAACGVFTSVEREGETVAASNARRVVELYEWLRARGFGGWGAAESVAAERYEHVRQSSAAAKYAAAHAALVCALGRVPDFAPARAVKRAVVGCDVATKRVVEAAVRRQVDGAGAAFDRLRGERKAGHVEHLADACAVALHALGLCVAPLLVSRPGECPSIAHLPERPQGDELHFPEGVDGRALIVAGEWARKVLRLKAQPTLTWREAQLGGGRFMAAVLPGAADRFWRSAANRHRADLFLRAAARPT